MTVTLPERATALPVPRHRPDLRPVPLRAVVDGLTLDLGEEALAWRDSAVAAMNSGRLVDALVLARTGLSVLEAERAEDGLDAVAIRITMAQIQEELGGFTDAHRTIGAAVGILERVPVTGEHDRLLWCQAHERLAGLQRIGGDVTGAATRLRMVLERASAWFGEAHLSVISASNALGIVSKHAGWFEESAAAYDRALAALDALPDADPALRAGLLHNLGGLAHARGDAPAGIEVAESGLALRVAAVGAHHPDCARDRNALGALYQLAGRMDEAELMCRQALRVFEQAYGPHHYEVGMTLANLAVLAGDQGRYAEAESLGRRTLAILVTSLGPYDTEVGVTLLNLSGAVAEQGRRIEARAFARRAARIFTARLPVEHPYVRATQDAIDQLTARV